MISAIAVSCDDDEPSAGSRPECTPTKLTVGWEEYEYEYNSKGQLITSVAYPYNHYIKYEYGNNQLVRITYYSNEDLSDIFDIDEIEYNDKGQWIRHNGTKTNHVAIANYDELGNRTEVIIKVNNKLTQSYAYEYTNGNMTARVITVYDAQGSVSYKRYHTFEYYLDKENKLSQFESLVQYGYAFDSRLGHEPTPSKNLLKRVNTLSDETTVFISADFEYEFNEKGYPTKISVSGADLNGDGQVNADDLAIWQFDYTCN